MKHELLDAPRVAVETLARGMASLAVAAAARLSPEALHRSSPDIALDWQTGLPMEAVEGVQDHYLRVTGDDFNDHAIVAPLAVDPSDLEEVERSGDRLGLAVIDAEGEVAVAMLPSGVILSETDWGERAAAVHIQPSSIGVSFVREHQDGFIAFRTTSASGIGYTTVTDVENHRSWPPHTPIFDLPHTKTPN